MGPEPSPSRPAGQATAGTARRSGRRRAILAGSCSRSTCCRPRRWSPGGSPRARPRCARRGLSWPSCSAPAIPGWTTRSCSPASSPGTRSGTRQGARVLGIGAARGRGGAGRGPGPPERIPHRRAAAEDETGGRGLELVNALAARWGFHRDTAGETVVWFQPADRHANPHLSRPRAGRSGTVARRGHATARRTGGLRRGRGPAPGRTCARGSARTAG